MVQVAQLRALAPTQGGDSSDEPQLIWFGVSHTNTSTKTCPASVRGITLKKQCVHACLDRLFNAMTLAPSQGTNSVWVLGGDFNLSHDVMKRALQDYEAPRGWDRTVMALGDKDNAEDGLWLISSNPVKDVLTDGRRGQVADHGTHFFKKVMRTIAIIM